jgi:RND family efflux transporter MFP subunit
MKISFYSLVGCVCLSIFACTPVQEEQSPEPSPRAVRVEPVTSKDLPIRVTSVGRLAPDREVVISAEVPGILMQYNADVGGKVSAGETLAQLDPLDYKLALKEAEANLRSARIQLSMRKKSYTRANRLLPEKAITPELFDQAETAYQAAQTTVSQLETMLAMAKRRLDKTAIKTPFGGHVTARYVETGQNIATGSPIMKIADMKAMRVKIYINELEYVHVDEDDPVTVTVEAFSQAPLTGRVDKIGIQADSRTNTFEVEILVENPEFKLKAGLTARVSIQSKVIPNAVMIAQNTVLFREDRKEVFVLDADDLAEARVVTLGRMDGSEVEITEGLKAGDRLIISGAQYVKPGDKVRVAQ